ncbi:lysozyme inhibitor LprI family protein [Leptospira sp. WS92.C1]
MKLKSTEDQKKCALKKYEIVDKELNKTYQTIRKTFSESTKRELKEVQQLWIGYRDGICEGPMYSPDETGIESILCKTKTTIERITYLKRVWLSGVPPTDGLGSYVDGFGGSLKLLRKKSVQEIQFELQVVRGPTAHVGEIGGNWTPTKEGKWTWASSPGCSKEDPECCLLEFHTIAASRIEVKEIYCSAYRGARASFDGDYRYEFTEKTLNRMNSVTR